MSHDRHPNELLPETVAELKWNYHAVKSSYGADLLLIQPASLLKRFFQQKKEQYLKESRDP